MSTLAAAFAPVHQQYLLEARQMQALSFAVHIPLVCFGIAFPAMVLFVEGLSLRTGDPTFRELARHWSKALVVLDEPPDRLQRDPRGRNERPPVDGAVQQPPAV